MRDRLEMDSAWKSSEETPSLELSASAQLPDATNCLACSEDGRYLGLGHSQGLSVWCTSSLACVADWLQDKLEITSIQLTKMAEGTYLLGAIDDMGVAKIFAYHSNSVHLLSVINNMEDINKRSICLTFELSEGGDFGAASFSCNTSFWFEIYYFPKKAWLKELETSQDPDFSEYDRVKWSLLAMKANGIKPPKSSAKKDLKDQDTPVADLLTYCLALDADNSSHQWNAEKTKEISKSQRCCIHHFLLPCGQFPGDCKSMCQPEQQPVAVCFWWSGSHNLLQYVLTKATTKKEPNEERMPDVLLPNAKKILCSAVSRCTRYLGLGLEDALVCVWDRQSGSPLAVLALATGSPFCRLHFVDYWPVSIDDFQTFTAAQVYLSVVCKSGAIYKVTAGRWTQSCISLLNENPKDSRNLPTFTTSVPFLQCLMLVMQKNGKIFLQDIVNKNTVCFLSAPKSNLIATSCKPIYTLNTKQTLFIRGDQNSSSSASSEEDNQSQLFIFHFEKSEIFKQYIVSLPHSPQQAKIPTFATLEETCNLYLQQRALSGHERNKAITQTWKGLQESGATMQERQNKNVAT